MLGFYLQIIWEVCLTAFDQYILRLKHFMAKRILLKQVITGIAVAQILFLKALMYSIIHRFQKKPEKKI